MVKHGVAEKAVARSKCGYLAQTLDPWSWSLEFKNPLMENMANISRSSGWKLFRFPNHAYWDTKWQNCVWKLEVEFLRRPCIIVSFRAFWFAWLSELPSFWFPAHESQWEIEAQLNQGVLWQSYTKRWILGSKKDLDHFWYLAIVSRNHADWNWQCFAQAELRLFADTQIRPEYYSDHCGGAKAF